MNPALTPGLRNAGLANDRFRNTGNFEGHAVDGTGKTKAATK